MAGSWYTVAKLPWMVVSVLLSGCNIFLGWFLTGPEQKGLPHSLYHTMIPTYGLGLLKNQQTWCVNTECNCYVVIDVQLYYIFYFRVIPNTKTNILVSICLDTYIIHDILLLSIWHFELEKGGQSINKHAREINFEALGWWAAKGLRSNDIESTIA